MVRWLAVVTDPNSDHDADCETLLNDPATYLPAEFQDVRDTFFPTWELDAFAAASAHWFEHACDGGIFR